MFDHVTIRSSDSSEAERFYTLVLSTIGVGPTASDEHYAQWGDFSLAAANGENPVTHGLHVAFTAPSRSHVDEFWRVGTGAGYRDDGAPEPRPQYSESYYGAFLLDPDGNSAEAVHHDSLRSDDGHIDHLWIRVADVGAAKRFYRLVAQYAGFRLAADTPDRAQFAADRGSFSLVAGPATRHLHHAFGVDDDKTVDAFHEAATEAGYRDNGPPGERPFTTRATTAPSCSIPTETTSSSCITTGPHDGRSLRCRMLQVPAKGSTVSVGPRPGPQGARPACTSRDNVSRSARA